MISTEIDVMHNNPVSMLDSWRDMVGRSFVLGRPNARGEHVVILGEKRWLIAQGEAGAGDRVRVTQMLEEILVVERA